MGFLDRIIKKSVGEAVGRAVGNSVGNALDKALNNNGSSNGSYYNNQQNNYGQNTYQQNNYGQNSYQQNVNNNTSMGYQCTDIRTEMESILSTEFSDYEIRREVPAASLGAVNARSYSYGMYRNGAPVVMIMITEHNKEQNRAFQGAKAACAQSNVKFLNFFTHMPNDRGYVVNRIRQAL